MAVIEVLIEGYAFRRGAAIQASSSVCLIRSNAGKLIITDPGCNRDALAEALEKHAVSPEEIDYVFLSHHHFDHLALAAWFDQAIIIPCEDGLLYTQDEMLPIGKEGIGHDLTILATPGHCENHQSLLVKTSDGIVAVAGDVFWYWADSETPAESGLPGDEIPYDAENLQKSRLDLLKKAHIIIPGHGKAVSSQTLRELLNLHDLQENTEINDKKNR